jgi:hypothetical protein
VTLWSGPHVVERAVALVLTGASAAAMLYVGLDQSRVVEGMWCPLLGKGGEVVAAATFAYRPRVGASQ